MIKDHAPLPVSGDPRLTPDERKKASDIVKKLVESENYWVYQWEPQIGIMDNIGVAVPPNEADKIIRRLTKEFIDKQNQI